MAFSAARNMLTSWQSFTRRDRGVGRRATFCCSLSRRVFEAYTRTAVVIASLLICVPANAQLATAIPGGVSAFEVSEDQCFYEPSVRAAIAKINKYYRALDARAWRRNKAQFTGQVVLLTNAGSVMGGASACKTLGIAVSDALGIGVLITGLDADEEKAVKRLSSGGGRGINEPPPPEVGNRPSANPAGAQPSGGSNPK